MFSIATPRLRCVLLAVPLSILLSACSKPEPKAEDVRPVRALVLAAGDAAASAEFSGEVRPRFESRLGFRVGGKIVARRVDVGDTVKRGQVLMQLDPQDLKLGQDQAFASLRAAETARDLAQDEAKRYQDLKSRNFVSQSVLDAKLGALRQAQANVDAARALYRGQSNQAAYATLVADADGVVSSVDAEVGQVVGAGTPVVRVARTTDKDVVIGVPENRVADLRHVGQATVRLWAAPDDPLPGTIREVSPVADPATRTYTVKVAVPARPEVRLGMTATVQLAARSGAPVMRVPLTALVQEKGAAAVWVVEGGVARLVPVQVGQPVGNEIVLAGGVRPGQTVVTAGVHLLKNGQKVKILAADVSRRADADPGAQIAGGAAQ